MLARDAEAADILPEARLQQCGAGYVFGWSVHVAHANSYDLYQ